MNARCAGVSKGAYRTCYGFDTAIVAAHTAVPCRRVAIRVGSAHEVALAIVTTDVGPDAVCIKVALLADQAGREQSAER